MAKSRLQMRFQSSGHTTAALRAMSYASPLSKLKDLTSGIGYYEIVKQIEEHFEEEKDVLIKNLQTLTKLLFRPENMMAEKYDKVSRRWKKHILPLAVSRLPYTQTACI